MLAMSLMIGALILLLLGVGMSIFKLAPMWVSLETLGVALWVFAEILKARQGN